jgi:hypothetical protein
MLQQKVLTAALLAAVTASLLGFVYVVTTPDTHRSEQPTPIVDEPRAPPQPEPIGPPRPPINWPPPVRATPAIHLAVRNALVAAGVDEDKVDAPAADLSASIEQAIAAKTDELWFWGKIAGWSLVPLWIIALVALFRHKKPPVDLWSRRALVLDADR